jgi:hypothetical protein
VRSTPVAIGSVEPKEKIKDLVQWTISDEYFALRDQLGLVVTPAQRNVEILVFELN